MQIEAKLKKLGLNLLEMPKPVSEYILLYRYASRP